METCVPLFIILIADGQQQQWDIDVKGILTEKSGRESRSVLSYLLIMPESLHLISVLLELVCTVR